MSRRRKDLIDHKFYARIGRVVVEFGALEAVLRTATSGSICPAINEILCDALLARTRFTELVDLYTFFVSFALKESLDYEIIKVRDKKKLETALDDLRKKLLSINERRNSVVHSWYIEAVYDSRENPSAEVQRERKLEASKPYLHRRALDGGANLFNPFTGTLDSVIDTLIEDIAAGHRDFWAFDNTIIPYVNHVWERHAARVVSGDWGI